MPLYRFYFNERAFGIVDVLVAAAREAGCTPAQLALAWQLAKPEITRSSSVRAARCSSPTTWAPPV